MRDYHRLHLRQVVVALSRLMKMRKKRREQSPREAVIGCPMRRRRPSRYFSGVAICKKILRKMSQ
jgi:hypothetical protein